MKKGFDKMQEEDDDIIVGTPIVQRPVTVTEIISRVAALHDACVQLNLLVANDPTNENNQKAYDRALVSYNNYINRVYSPIV